MTKDDLDHIAPENDTGVDAMVWTLVYRDGPLSREDIARLSTVRVDTLEAVLGRLVDSGRIGASTVEGRTMYSSAELVIPIDAATGWEAAVLDHFQAVVRTVIAKLHQGASGGAGQAVVGGSTYTFLVWPGHPFHDEALAELSRSRAARSELRARIDAYNAQHGIPARHLKSFRIAASP